MLALLLASHFALIGGLLWWCGAAIGLLLVLPLLAPLPGLLKGRPYTGAWASLLIVFYVAGLLAETYGLQQRHAIGGALTLIAMVDFVATLLFVRWAARERAA